MNDSLAGLEMGEAAPATPVPPTRTWGSSGWLQSAAVSPEGKRLVTGARAGAITLWDLTTERKIRSWSSGPGTAALSIKFSPDGRTIVAGGEGFGVAAWDAASGDRIWNLKGRSALVYDIEISPDGRWVASSEKGGLVRIADLASGRELRSLRGGSTDEYAVAISPDGTRIASGGDGPSLELWDAQTGRELRRISVQVRGEDPKRFCNCALAFVAGDRIASADRGRLRVFDVSDGRLVSSVPGADQMAVSPDGKAIVTGSEHNLWLYTGGRSWKLSLDGRVNGLDALTIAPDHEVIAGEVDMFRAWKIDR